MTLRSNQKSNLQLRDKPSQHMMMRSLLVFSFLWGGVFWTGRVLSGPLVPSPVIPSVSERPFWRTKPKVMHKITEDRAIIVSVKTEKNGRLSHLHMVGGGLTNRSAEGAFRQAKKYENLKKVSDHILEARFHPEKKQLYLHTQAFRYHARMTMTVDLDESNSKKRRMRFHVIEGNFKGMTGAISFEDFRPNATLMGFEAHYEYEKLPMPNFFIEFGLEFVLQKVAARMRTFLEKEAPL